MKFFTIAVVIALSFFVFSPNLSAQQQEKLIVSSKTADGKAKSFEELLAEFKGKVVYIDFWASWCGPCIAEMPYSEKLHHQLEGKDVVFLYISLDSEPKAWEKALTRIKNKGYHFLPEKSVMAEISKKFSVSMIPRYMIADKSGKIVVKDAPRPSDEKAAFDLEKYLSKN